MKINGLYINNKLDCNKINFGREEDTLVLAGGSITIYQLKELEKMLNKGETIVLSKHDDNLVVTELKSMINYLDLTHECCKR